jgi:hypothetical protein
MKTQVLTFALTATLVASSAFAQVEPEHLDVEFGYSAGGTELEIEVGEVTATGVPIFEGTFEEFDSFFDAGNLTAEDPGFATAPDEGLDINVGDQIFLNVLDSSTSALFGGLGYVTRYNPLTDQLEAAGQISIIDNTAGTADLVLDGDSIVSGPTSQFIAEAEADLTGGVDEFDEHIVFDLLNDNAPPAAYGILVELQSNFAGTSLDEFELTSEPFWIILNNGIELEEFEEFAVRAFETAAIPEPGTFGLLAAGMAGVLLRRRR